MPLCSAPTYAEWTRQMNPKQMQHQCGLQGGGVEYFSTPAAWTRQVLPSDADFLSIICPVPPCRIGVDILIQSGMAVQVGKY